MQRFFDCTGQKRKPHSKGHQAYGQLADMSEADRPWCHRSAHQCSLHSIPFSNSSQKAQTQVSVPWITQQWQFVLIAAALFITRFTFWYHGTWRTANKKDTHVETLLGSYTGHCCGNIFEGKFDMEYMSRVWGKSVCEKIRILWSIVVHAWQNKEDSISEDFRIWRWGSLEVKRFIHFGLFTQLNWLNWDLTQPGPNYPRRSIKRLMRTLSHPLAQSVHSFISDQWWLDSNRMAFKMDHNGALCTAGLPLNGAVSSGNSGMTGALTDAS